MISLKNYVTKKELAILQSKASETKQIKSGKISRGTKIVRFLGGKVHVGSAEIRPLRKKYLKTGLQSLTEEEKVFLESYIDRYNTMNKKLILA